MKQKVFLLIISGNDLDNAEVQSFNSKEERDQVLRGIMVPDDDYESYSDPDAMRQIAGFLDNDKVDEAFNMWSGTDEYQQLNRDHYVMETEVDIIPPKFEDDKDGLAALMRLIDLVDQLSKALDACIGDSDTPKKYHERYVDLVGKADECMAKWGRR